MHFITQLNIFRDSTACLHLYIMNDLIILIYRHRRANDDDNALGDKFNEIYVCVCDKIVLYSIYRASQIRVRKWYVYYLSCFMFFVVELIVKSSTKISYHPSLSLSLSPLPFPNPSIHSSSLLSSPLFLPSYLSPSLLSPSLPYLFTPLLSLSPPLPSPSPPHIFTPTLSSPPPLSLPSSLSFSHSPPFSSLPSPLPTFTACLF